MSGVRRFARSAVGLLLAGLAATRADAQELRSIAPRGASPGERVEVVCEGRGLSDLVAWLNFEPGIDVVEVVAERDTRARVTLAVREDCPLGARLFMLHTRRGLTRPAIFTVGPLPSVRSARDNHSADRAQPIALDVTVDGRIDAERTDWFAFDATAGEVVSFEVEGQRLGGSDFDPQIELFDATGELLLRCDDAPLGKLDPIARWRCAVDGNYRIALRDVAFRGSSRAGYRLHVGRFPRPAGLVPAGGRPGERIVARTAGLPIEVDVEVRLPERSGRQPVFVSIDGRSVPTPLFVCVDERPGFVEGRLPADAPAAPYAFHGVVAEPGEEDRCPLTARKGERLTIRALARALGSGLDPVLVVRDAAGKDLASDDDGGEGLDSRLRFTAPADGRYELVVRDRLGGGGADHFYRLEVGELPDVATTRELVPGRRAEDLGIALPQGGRNATIVQLAGLDRDALITLGWDGLSDGVRVEPLEVPKAATAVPVVFSAAADAPLTVGFATPTATVDSAAQERPIRHEHPFPLLRVENDQIAIAAEVRMLPVAVTAPAPFAIDVVAPAVPLVQGGSARLPLRLTRAADFDGSVSLRMLATPSGVSAGSAKLSGSEAEAELALNAQTKAAAGTWPCVVVASATIDGVVRSVSSACFTLTIEAPWISTTLPRIQLERGAVASLRLPLERRLDFAGELLAEIGGLPKGVVVRIPAPPPGADGLDVELVAAADAALGRHRSLFVKLTVRTAAGDVVQTFRGGELRIDEPIAEPAAGSGEAASR